MRLHFDHIRIRSIIALCAIAISFSGCSHRDNALPPINGTGASAAQATPSKKTLSIEVAPDNGCNFYSNGDVMCSSNCTGTSGGGLGGYAFKMVCDGGGPVFAPQPVSGGYVGVSNPFGVGGGGYHGTPVPPSSAYSYAQRIWDSAQKFKQTHSARNSTLNFQGAWMSTPAASGNECMAVVQQILVNAGLSLVGQPPGSAYIPYVEPHLQNQGYTELTSQSQAQAGDLVIQGNEDHIGICEDNGCTQMISNSSTPESFTWETSPANFAASYPQAVPNHFWHHT